MCLELSEDFKECLLRYNPCLFQAEVRDAIRNVTESHEDGAIFQSSNTDESNCELLALHGVAEEPGYLHRNNSSPLVIYVW